MNNVLCMDNLKNDSFVVFYCHTNARIYSWNRLFPQWSWMSPSLCITASGFWHLCALMSIRTEDLQGLSAMLLPREYETEPSTLLLCTSSVTSFTGVQAKLTLVSGSSVTYHWRWGQRELESTQHLAGSEQSSPWSLEVCNSPHLLLPGRLI